MPSPYKSGGRIQPHREQAKAEKALALEKLNATLEPLQIDPPEWLADPAARAAWIDLHPLLPHEVVRQCDAPLFALACLLTARQIGGGDLNAAGTAALATCLDKLGMTPAGRRKLASMTRAGGDARGDRFARFAD